MLKIYLKLLQKHRPSAGWTLAELMIAAAMTFVVVMVAGFGLVMILRENKVANATGEMQYDLNRATDFISEEIRNAKTIETRTSELKDTAKTFWNWKKGKNIEPVLALKIDGVHERVIYYVEEVEEDDIWRGPAVIKRFGPDFDENGKHKEQTRTNVDKWRHIPLVDMMVSDLDDSQKQCKDLPDTTADPNTYIARDEQGEQWYRWPQADADVKGFFTCISKNKQLVQLNVVGTSLDEFKHLYDKDKAQRMVRDEDKQTRHTAKMEYNVTTMVHARSEVIGSSGEQVPRYVVNPAIVLEEEGTAIINVLHAEIPCSYTVTDETGLTSTDDIRANFIDGADGVVGSVTGTGTGESYTFSEGSKASVHLQENVNCSSVNGKQLIRDNGNDVNIRFATNDNSDHPKLDDIMPNPPANIVSKLSQEGFIKQAKDGSFDFTLPDNIVLYFVEFAFDNDDDLKDAVTGKYYNTPQDDYPHFDDYIYFVELTK
ncbi:MAG: Tfp pilus assembly protein FimT/FimU [Crocosphaera sp.]